MPGCLDGGASCTYGTVEWVAGVFAIRGKRKGGSMRSLGQDFKAFILRGNVIDLAVAVVIAAAFGNVVAAFVRDLVTPLIAAIDGQPDFSQISFTINNSEFLIGDFINAVIAFLIMAAVIFFFEIKPMNILMERSRREPTPDPTTTKCPACLSEIPLAATRCAFCTTELSGADPAAGATAVR